MQNPNSIRLGPLNSLQDLGIAVQELADKDNEIIRHLAELALQKVPAAPVAPVIPVVELPELIWENIDQRPVTLDGYGVLQETKQLASLRAAAAVQSHTVLDNPHPQYLTPAVAAELFAGIGLVTALASLLEEHTSATTDVHGIEDTASLMLQGDPIAWSQLTGNLPYTRLPSGVGSWNAGTTAGVSNDISIPQGLRLATSSGTGAFVGIGTLTGTPGAKLHVASSSAAQFVQERQGTATNVSTIYRTVAAGVTSDIYIGQGTVGEFAVDADSNMVDALFRVMASTGAIRAGGLLGADRSAATSVAIQARLSADAQARLQIRADGRMSWGSGAAAVDVYLTRIAAGAIALNGALNMLPVTAPATPASGYYFYCDSADGLLKAKSAAGVVTTLA